MIRAAVVSLSLLFFAAAGAAPPATRTIDTGIPFATYLERLERSVRVHGLGVVAVACADCGARAIGETIPGNRVIMVFAPRYAVRMLRASVAAGIEAPLRLYVTERPDGTAWLTYRLPSAVFARYGVAELDRMAAELDALFERIVAAAGG